MDTLYNLALLATSAELLGVMEEAQRITLDYLRDPQAVRQADRQLPGAAASGRCNIILRTEAVRSLIYQVAANNDACASIPRW